MKKLCFIVIVVLSALFISGTFCSCQETSSQTELNKDKDNSKKDIPIVLDSSKFNGISVDELKEALGEPNNLEDWNNQTSKGTFQLQIYTYNFNDFYSEFILHNDTVVKIRSFSNSQWAIAENDFDNIFAMFGIVPNNSLRKTVDNGFTLKFSPVSDDVSEVEVFDIDKENHSFSMLYVTFDSAYFE